MTTRTAAVVRTVADLDRALSPARTEGSLIGLVPTLGALHDGHRSLIAAARGECDVVVVSVFLNPFQFDDPSDLARYPSGLGADIDLVASTGADLVFAPEIGEMYPAGEAQVTVDPGWRATVLDGAARPGHMRAVATVVTKLLSVVRPGRAYFGEKDYLQLVVVRRLVADLSVQTAIVACPVVRQPDGLALSSRNAFLGGDERQAATALWRALSAGAALYAKGVRQADELVSAMRQVLDHELLVETEYATVVAEGEVVAVEVVNGPARLMVAARLGGVRLIDNLVIGAR